MLDLSKKEIEIAIMLLLIGGIIYFLFQIKIILMPFILGILLAYLFNPFIKMMKKRNYSRQGALILLLIMILNVIIVSGLILFPIFINELENLSIMIPGYINSIENIFDHLNKEYRRLHLPLIFQEPFNQFLQQLEEYMINLIQRITETLLNSLSFIISLLIAPIISYYILRDIEIFQQVLLRVIPRKRKKIIIQLVKEVNEIFVGFLRGQIWISIIVAILVGIGLFFLKVKFFLILGLLAGITNMIPYIGPIIGGLPAVFIAFLSSPLQALGVILLFIILQQVESSIIAPKIMSKKVGLHPLTIIFSLLAGAEIFGIWGLLFAIPVAGSIKVLIKLLMQQFTPLNNTIE